MAKSKLTEIKINTDSDSYFYCLSFKNAEHLDPITAPGACCIKLNVGRNSYRWTLSPIKFTNLTSNVSSYV